MLTERMSLLADIIIILYLVLCVFIVDFKIAINSVSFLAYVLALFFCIVFIIALFKYKRYFYTFDFITKIFTNLKIWTITIFILTVILQFVIRSNLFEFYSTGTLVEQGGQFFIENHGSTIKELTIEQAHIFKAENKLALLSTTFFFFVFGQVLLFKRPPDGRS